MKQLAIFTTPDDATVLLRHDSGPWFTATAGTVQGRPAWILTIDGVPDGHGAMLVVTRKDYSTIEQRGTLWLARPGPFAEFVVDDVRLPRKPTVTLPRLVIRGQYFQLETGQRWTGIQCSDFNMLNRWQHDDPIVEDVIKQRRDCGFNLLRVWTLFDIPLIGTFRDIDYRRVSDFARWCASYGQYVEFTAFTSIEIPQHWEQLVSAVIGSTNALTELVNEYDHGGQVNHIDLSRYSRPSGVLASHGSNTVDSWPVEPVWDYVTVHWNGATEWQRKVGHNTMESADRYSVPALANENTRCPDHDSNTVHYHDAAAGAALLCAGSCFHSVHGKDSTLWIGIELDCARAHAAGARSVDLSFQDAPYRRRDDLLVPGVLRAYQRGSSPVVFIHA